MGIDFQKPSTKEIGAFGEQQAAKYLMRHGYWIKDRNFHAGKYEIDLVAVSLFTIAFVEVKTRNYRPKDLEDPISPSRAVDQAKIKFTKTAAKQYLRRFPTWKKLRMDIIEIWMTDQKVFRIRHIKNAY